jgi:hypothetical protein
MVKAISRLHLAPAIRSVPVVPADPTTHPVPTDLRARVDDVMDHCLERYDYFSDFLKALREANGGGRIMLGESEDHTQLSRLTANYMKRQSNPSYAYVQALLDSNALHLDPDKIQPETDGKPAGGHRIKLFTMAGLIKVTPQSTQQHNQEICAGVEKRIDQIHTDLPSWNETVRKLVNFQTQGERRSYEDIIAEMKQHSAAEPVQKLTRKSLAHMFIGRQDCPQDVRTALHEVLGLTEQQSLLLDQLPQQRLSPLFHRRTGLITGDKTAHAMIQEAQALPQPVPVYPLLLSLLNASDVKVNRYFHPVDHNDAVALLEPPFAELREFLFDRKPGVSLANVKLLLNYITEIQAARGNAPLSGDDRNAIIVMAEKSVPAAAKPIENETSWKERLTTIGVNGQATPARS